MKRRCRIVQIKEVLVCLNSQLKCEITMIESRRTLERRRREREDQREKREKRRKLDITAVD